MTTVTALSEAEISQRLTHLPLWQLHNGALHRSLVFKNFIEAFGFMAQVAILAEKANHHPEWSNVYKRVEINLSTHEVGGISERDFNLAERIDRLLPA